MEAYKVYPFINYDDIPKDIKIFSRDAWEFLDNISLMLEFFNDRVVTPRNMKDMNDVLGFMNIKIKYGNRIRIYIGEHKQIFISFSLFKIHVHIDLD